jgi:ABC-type cobalamin transport system ATPase subunit
MSDGEYGAAHGLGFGDAWWRRTHRLGGGAWQWLRVAAVHKLGS